jgi:Inner membrane component of T3SS, cytoplasmic domain
MSSQPSSSQGDSEEVGPRPSEAGLDAELDRAVPAGEAEAFLIVVQGHVPGRVFALTHNTVLVGRIDGADVLISDPSVSGRHARIINGSHGFEIEDLDSTNGTFIGGQRVRRSRLNNGDRVTVGSVEFTFRIDKLVDPTVALLPPARGGPQRLFEGALARQTYPMHFPPPFGSQSAPRRRIVRGPSDEVDEGPSLDEVLQRIIAGYRFVSRHAALIVTLAAAGTAAGLVSIFFLPPAASATCVVKLQPQMRSNPVDTEKPSEDSPQLFEGSERAFVSPALLRTTLHQLDGAEPDEARISSVTSRLKFEPLEEAHLYKASYKESLLSGRRQLDPVVFLTTHLHNYAESEITKALKTVTAESEFLRNQVKSVDSDLANISNERTAFRQVNFDRLPEEAVQTQSSRFQLEGRRAELQAQIRRFQEDLDAERRQQALEGPVAQSRYQSSQFYRQSLATVNQKLSEAYAQGLADGHPEVRQLNDEKQRLEKLIEGEMHATPTPVDREANSGLQAQQGRIETLRGQLNAARAELADTQKNLGQIRSLVGDLPRVEAHLQDLNRRQDAVGRLHTQLFDKLKKAELQLNLERVSAESRYEMSPPRLEKPGRTQTIALRCGIGLIVGLLVASLIVAIQEGRRLFSRALKTYDANQPADNT